MQRIQTAKRPPEQPESASYFDEPSSSLGKDIEKFFLLFVPGFEAPTASPVRVFSRFFTVEDVAFLVADLHFSLCGLDSNIPNSIDSSNQTYIQVTNKYEVGFHSVGGLYHSYRQRLGVSDRSLWPYLWDGNHSFVIRVCKRLDCEQSCG